MFTIKRLYEFTIKLKKANNRLNKYGSWSGGTIKS